MMIHMPIDEDAPRAFGERAERRMLRPASVCTARSEPIEERLQVGHVGMPVAWRARQQLGRCRHVLRKRRQVDVNCLSGG
jgi:hypothetical protein